MEEREVGREEKEREEQGRREERETGEGESTPPPAATVLTPRRQAG